MAIITYPLNNIEYTAEDAEPYHATRTSGVFANDDFPITVSGSGNVVTIGEGIGWIRNSKFSGKVVANKQEMSLDLGLPHATHPRLDAIVLQFNANANASEIIVKNGTAQTDPEPPEVVRTESVYELHLYHVYREAGAASVTSNNVTDLRSNDTYCGLMSDDVTMLGDDYVSKDMIGVANGVASLNNSGKVPNSQLPAMNYIPKSQKGVANGVATLNNSGKVPSSQLPDMDYIPASNKGVANGVATLDGNGKVTANQASSSIVDIAANTTLSASHLGKFIRAANGATITLPENMEWGGEVEIYNFGESDVYINAESTVSIAFDGSQWTGRTLTLHPFGLVGLKKVSTQIWKVSGEAEG